MKCRPIDYVSIENIQKKIDAKKIKKKHTQNKRESMMLSESVEKMGFNQIWWTRVCSHLTAAKQMQ